MRLVRDARERSRPMPEGYDITLKGLAMPACLSWTHWPALVLWLLRREVPGRESEESAGQKSNAKSIEG